MTTIDDLTLAELQRAQALLGGAGGELAGRIRTAHAVMQVLADAYSHRKVGLAPPVYAPLAPVGPVPPRPYPHGMTPTRLGLLSIVAERRVYAEAGQAWAVDGRKLTSRVTEALAAGWVQEGVRRTSYTRWYELTDAGREAMAGGAQ